MAHLEWAAVDVGLGSVVVYDWLMAYKLVDGKEGATWKAQSDPFRVGHHGCRAHKHGGV